MDLSPTSKRWNAIPKSNPKLCHILGLHATFKKAFSQEAYALHYCLVIPLQAFTLNEWVF